MSYISKSNIYFTYVLHIKLVLEVKKNKIKFPPDFRVAFYTQVGIAGTIILQRKIYA